LHSRIILNLPRSFTDHLSRSSDFSNDCLVVSNQLEATNSTLILSHRGYLTNNKGLASTTSLWDSRSSDGILQAPSSVQRLAFFDLQGMKNDLNAELNECFSFHETGQYYISCSSVCYDRPQCAVEKPHIGSNLCKHSGCCTRPIMSVRSAVRESRDLLNPCLRKLVKSPKLA
jgi:hypothetical protein